VPPLLGGARRAARASPPEAAAIRSLTKRSDFDLLFSTGSRIRRGGITVVRAPAPDGETAVGVIAGRRVGSAVRRNRAKRRLRAAIAEVSLPSGELIGVLATDRVLDAPFGTLVEWLSEALEVSRV
jgi:ribonuclease P protein component